MGEVVKTDNGTLSVATGAPKRKNKREIGGPMSVEELRINKSLLKEISKRKKEKMGGARNTSCVS